MLGRIGWGDAAKWNIVNSVRESGFGVEAWHLPCGANTGRHSVVLGTWLCKLPGQRMLSCCSAGLVLPSQAPCGVGEIFLVPISGGPASWNGLRATYDHNVPPVLPWFAAPPQWSGLWPFTVKRGAP